ARATVVSDQLTAVHLELVPRVAEVDPTVGCPENPGGRVARREAVEIGLRDEADAPKRGERAEEALAQHGVLGGARDEVHTGAACGPSESRRHGRRSEPVGEDPPEVA